MTNEDALLCNDGMSRRREAQLFSLLDRLAELRTAAHADFCRTLVHGGEASAAETEMRDIVRLERRVLRRLGLDWEAAS